MTKAPTTMVHQPNTKTNLCPTSSTPLSATNMPIDSNLPYSVPKKGEQKGATTPSTLTIQLFCQRRLFPSPPTTVVAAIDIDHPGTPPTKKRIPTNQKGSINNSTRTPQTPPEASVFSSWLRIDLTMPTPNPSQYSCKDILLALQTFSFAAW